MAHASLALSRLSYVIMPKLDAVKEAVVRIDAELCEIGWRV